MTNLNLIWENRTPEHTLAFIAFLSLWSHTVHRSDIEAVWNHTEGGRGFRCGRTPRVGQLIIENEPHFVVVEIDVRCNRSRLKIKPWSSVGLYIFKLQKGKHRKHSGGYSKTERRYAGKVGL